MSKNILMDMNKVRDFISKQSPNSKYYLGCDSDCSKRRDGSWYATYVTVLVVHKNGNNGCKLFGKVDIEPIYSYGKGKQSLRLMTEVYKVSEMYMELNDLLHDKKVEIHLDINSDSKYDSHIILGQAMGYIKGVCGITPKIKPEAFAASYCADRLIRVKEEYPALYA